MRILSIFSLSINKFKSEKSKTFNLSLKTIYLVLETLRVSLFALNQSASLHNSTLASLNRDCGSDPDIWRLVSSAKRIVKNSEALGRSFIRIRNSIGPKMLPWGTPQLSSNRLDNFPFMEVHCCRPVK